MPTETNENKTSQVEPTHFKEKNLSSTEKEPVESTLDQYDTQKLDIHRNNPESESNSKYYLIIILNIKTNMMTTMMNMNLVLISKKYH